MRIYFRLIDENYNIILIVKYIINNNARQSSIDHHQQYE